MNTLARTPIELVQQMLRGTAFSARLFGSRASGRAHEKSDWDIAIYGPGRMDPILLMDIEEAIDQANFAQSVDLVDLFMASERLREEVERNSL